MTLRMCKGQRTTVDSVSRRAKPVHMSRKVVWVGSERALSEVEGVRLGRPKPASKHQDRSVKMALSTPAPKAETDSNAETLTATLLSMQDNAQGTPCRKREQGDYDFAWRCSRHTLC